MLTCKYAKAEIKKQEELDVIIRKLVSKGYAAIARGALDAVCDIAGIPKYALGPNDLVAESPYFIDPESEANHNMGDLFVKDSSLFFLAAIGPRVEAYEICKQSTTPAIDQFCAAVQAAAQESLDGRRLRGMEFAWIDTAPVRYSRRQRMRRSQTAKLDEKKPDYTPDDATRAELFSNKPRRSFLLSLAQSRGKIRRSDTKDISESDIITPLVAAGVIRREYLMLCKKDSHTICTVSSLEKLTGDTECMKCSECGRALKDENHQEIYALTEIGKALLDKSRWMSIWATECLIKSGVPASDIVWNASAAEDELDVIATILGYKVFIELKDREFGLGDAYPFAFRVNRYGGDYGVIVTTERIAEEAKKFLGESTPGVERKNFVLIEGQDVIPTKLGELTHSVSRSAVLRFITSIGERFGIRLISVVHSWLQKQEKLS